MNRTFSQTVESLQKPVGRDFLLHTAEPSGYLAETGEAGSQAWDMASAGDLMGGLSHFFRARPELVLGALGLLGGGLAGGKKRGAWLGPLLAAVLGGGAYAWRNKDKWLADPARTAVREGADEARRQLRPFQRSARQTALDEWFGPTPEAETRLGWFKLPNWRALARDLGTPYQTGLDTSGRQVKYKEYGTLPQMEAMNRRRAQR